jgi:hypothetical protein
MTTKTIATQDDVDEWLELVVFKPFAQEGWEITGEVTPSGSLVLAVRNPLARDSRTFVFDADTDDWTLMDGRPQTFSRAWPMYSIDGPEAFYAKVAEIVAWAGAHEALEWLRVWRGRDVAMIHDPHEDGEPTVMLW